MSKLILAAITGVAVLVISVLQAGKAAPPPLLKEPEAYAIYNVALATYVNHDKNAKVSIVKFTRLHKPFNGCLNEAHDSNQWNSAVEALKRYNSVRYALADNFHLPFVYQLVEKMEPVGGVRAPPPGMSYTEFLHEQLGKLKKMMKQHRSQVQFSVPGISDNGQIAIVYLANSFSGTYFALRKRNGIWTVDKDLRCGWIS